MDSGRSRSGETASQVTGHMRGVASPAKGEDEQLHSRCWSQCFLVKANGNATNTSRTVLQMALKDTPKTREMEVSSRYQTSSPAGYRCPQDAVDPPLKPRGIRGDACCAPKHRVDLAVEQVEEHI